MKTALHMCRWLPAACIFGYSWYLSSQESIAHMPHFWNADKFVHCICFAGLAFWVAFGAGTKARAHWRILLPIIVVSAYGIIDEIHQCFTPGRESSIFDWLADTFGAFIGSYIFFAIYTWFEKRDYKKT